MASIIYYLNSCFTQSVSVAVGLAALAPSMTLSLPAACSHAPASEPLPDPLLVAPLSPVLPVSPELLEPLVLPVLPLYPAPPVSPVLAASPVPQLLLAPPVSIALTVLTVLAGPFKG